jgi:hypothetical protein
MAVPATLVNTDPAEGLRRRSNPPRSRKLRDYVRVVPFDDPPGLVRQNGLPHPTQPSQRLAAVGAPE